jgi:hypothetical protein
VAAVSTGEHRQQQQRDNIGDLDHRVDRGTGRVLVGITDRITRDRGLMGLRALAAKVTVFDIFLGVVPSAASLRHRDGDE